MIGVNFDDRSDIKSDPRCELNSTQIFVLSYISSYYCSDGVQQYLWHTRTQEGEGSVGRDTAGRWTSLPSSTNASISNYQINVLSWSVRAYECSTHFR